MSQVTITDKDREAAHALRRHECSHGYRSWASCNDCIAAFIAQAREEATRVEREACAQACGAPDSDPTDDDPCSGNDGDTFDWGVRCASYWNASAIRARREV